MSRIDEGYIQKFIDEMCSTDRLESRDYEEETFLEEVASLPPVELATLVIQVLERPASWLYGKSIDELGLFQDNLFSSVNGFWWTIREKPVPLDLQAQAVNGLKPLLTFLDPYCDENGRDPAQGTNNLNRLDGAVYMTWDKDTLEGAAIFPGEEHLVEPILTAMEHMLTLRSCAMQLGGLHGLGHMKAYHEKRVEDAIDRFSRSRHVRIRWLLGYAQQARTGNIL